MAKFDPGKWAEGEVAKWLESRSQQDAGFAWHRFPDARAAMGRLSAQPADFLVSVAVTSGNRTTYLEVKETAQERRLPKTKVGQYGMLRKFYWTKAEVMVLIYMSTKKKWCYLQADQYVDDLFHYDDCPASFPIADLPTYDTAAEALQSFF